MKVSLLQENLLGALTKTGRIVSTKPQLPILQNVLLVTEEGRLRLTTTNTETTVNARVGAKIEKEGGICVSSRLFTELVTSLSQETIHLVAAEGALHVSGGGAEASIPGIPTTEFPAGKKGKSTRGSPIEKKALLTALDTVLFSAAADPGRPILGGVKFKKDGKEMVVVTTDGYRLSLARVGLTLLDKVDLVVPARALSEVLKVGLEDKETEKIELSEGNEGELCFSVGDTEIITRTIDGQYPEYAKIIPTTFLTRTLFDTEVFLRAVKSASVFAKDNANIVRLHIENQSVTVSSSAPGIGENKVEIDAKVNGEGGDISFNCRFLLEFLGRTTESELLFEMTGSLNPGVFRPVKDDSRLHIIMPVRVNAE